MRITPNQTILDISVMSSGTVSSVFEILAANNKGITDIPHAGDDYLIPVGITTDDYQLNYIAQNKIMIGTGDDPTLYIGISYWQIEVDFKIS